LETKLKEGPPEDELEQIGLRSEVLLDEFDKLKEELAPGRTGSVGSPRSAGR
jgi:hypothetical protein